MSKSYIILNGTVKFNGVCDDARSHCGSVCCKRTLVLLTEDEKKSGKYEYSEPTPDCGCVACQLMHKTGRAALKRKTEGCIYLDGSNKCSIYEDKPQQCKDFKCQDVWWNLTLPPNMVHKNNNVQS